MRKKLKYPLINGNDKKSKLETIIILRSTPKKDQLRVAVVGAENFAKSMHLPNLLKLSGLYHLRAIADIAGVNAKSVAERFKADYFSTNYLA